RFQEMVIEESFLFGAEEMNRTLGKFLEVASVVKTDMYHGPSGDTARVELWLDYEKGRAKGIMSFLYENNDWRIIGLSVDLPTDVIAIETSPEARAARVAAPPEIAELTDKI